MAALHPERVLGVVAIASGAPELMPLPRLTGPSMTSTRSWTPRKAGRRTTGTTGCGTGGGIAEFFFGELFCEPHSTKQREDAVGWAMETSPETVLAHDGRAAGVIVKGGHRAVAAAGALPGAGDSRGPGPLPAAVVERADRRADRGRPARRGGRGALPARPRAGGRQPCDPRLRATGSAQDLPPPRRWTRPLDRRRRVLYLSSPIGLGHARRDLAVADELRKLHPDLQVDWLAQHPVTELLARRGERIHPASAFLASESRHLEGECAEHDLHVFQAARRMDEIMISNFMVFSDLVARRALRPLGGRRGVGRGLFPAREPRAQAGALCLADRFRRLAADARRRRRGRRR